MGPFGNLQLARKLCLCSLRWFCFWQQALSCSSFSIKKGFFSYLVWDLYGQRRLCACCQWSGYMYHITILGSHALPALWIFSCLLWLFHFPDPLELHPRYDPGPCDLQIKHWVRIWIIGIRKQMKSCCCAWHHGDTAKTRLEEHCLFIWVNATLYYGF